jgi:uncharacterized protein
MKRMQATVQELEVWYVLPAVRKELAKVMKEKGLSQAKIAKFLGITEAAVSQYVKAKRAADVKLDLKLKPEIETAAKNIMNGKNQRREIQRLIHFAEKNHLICKVCPEHTSTCKQCFE